MDDEFFEKLHQRISEREKRPESAGLTWAQIAENEIADLYFRKYGDKPAQPRQTLEGVGDLPSEPTSVIDYFKREYLKWLRERH